MIAGYAQNSITPSLGRPVYLAGFGNNRRAETIHDELYARSLAIRTEQTTLLLVALDLIGFFRSDVYEVIQKVHHTYPEAQVIIASTHTHHGPDTLGLWGPDMKTRGVDEGYMSITKDKIAATILASLADLRPALVKWASAHVPGLAKNARNPEIVDNELTLAQLTSNGKPLATLFNFPCHPEVLWEQNPQITSDYVHYLRDEAEKQTGAPCIFFPGALGGMMSPDVRDHSFEEAEWMGRKLAQEGLRALETRYSRPSEVSIARCEIKARLTNILYKLAFRRKLLPDTRDKKGYIHSEVGLVKIGSLWLAAVPGELLPKLGLQLKDWMKGAGAEVAGVIGLANDELGYILPVEDFMYPLNPFRPGDHYEETNSIGKEIAPQVMDGIRGLL